MYRLEIIKEALRTHNPQRVEKEGFTRAAVLLPLIRENGELQLLLTVRTEDVEHHKGQVAFPGGAKEYSDKSAEATALRETFEELALPPTMVDVIGSIDDMWTPTGFVVTPLVAFIETLPELILQPSEVSEYFTVPLRFFMDDSNGYTKTYKRGDEEMDVWFYEYGDYTIWGVTAYIIRNFKLILEKGT